MFPTDCRVVADAESAANAAVGVILEQADVAIARRGRFTFALCGGSTPQRVYELLATTRRDWQHWQLIYGDERCLPRRDAERNSTLVERCWLENTDFPSANHHVPAVECGADAAAESYADAIGSLLPLDLALLGVGADGHTASLFPGHSHPANKLVVAVHNAPQGPAERISLSYGTLCGAATVCFLVTGPSKGAALARWRRGEAMPASSISGRHATILITDVPPEG